MGYVKQLAPQRTRIYQLGLGISSADLNRVIHAFPPIAVFRPFDPAVPLALNAHSYLLKIVVLLPYVQGCEDPPLHLVVISHYNSFRFSLTFLHEVDGHTPGSLNANRGLYCEMAVVPFLDSFHDKNCSRAHSTHNYGYWPSLTELDRNRGRCEISRIS